jgi:hypothetical protein
VTLVLSSVRVLQSVVVAELILINLKLQVWGVVQLHHMRTKFNKNRSADTHAHKYIYSTAISIAYFDPS